VLQARADQRGKEKNRVSSAITVVDLTKRYGAKTAVDYISMDAEFGTITALLGSNGAGKTTTLNCIVGLTSPSAGTILVDGKPLKPSDFESLSYVPDASPCYAWLTVDDHLSMTRGQFQRFDDSLARTLIERFGLSPRSKVGTLSKGQATALSLVLAFSIRPKTVLLDEPTNGLDPSAQRCALDCMIEAAGAGTAVLVSSHQVAHIERIADWVAILHRGKVVEAGAIDDLLAKHRTVEVVIGTRIVREDMGDGIDTVTSGDGSEETRSTRVVDCTLEDVYFRAVARAENR
jgi:ABC-2 type transport system ATP-binding protein